MGRSLPDGRSRRNELETDLVERGFYDCVAMDLGCIVRWQRTIIVIQQHAKFGASENDAIGALVDELLADGEYLGLV